MGMRWTNKRPTEPGFYYWQNEALHNISRNAVRVVQVERYKNRDGFSCQTLAPGCIDDVFDCDLGDEPSGRWAGPLPQPYF